MTIQVGDTLPDATLLKMTDDGPTTVQMSDLAGKGKVVIFGLPGAFTGTCTVAHVPSFIRTRAAFAEKGVDEVICVAVNDPFVVEAWSKHTGAGDGGITILGDAGAEFTKAVGMNFSAPPVGFYDRSKRYSMFVEDGVVRIFNPETSRDGCEISAGEALLAQI